MFRQVLRADCVACTGSLFYDKTTERFGHDTLPADFHPAIPAYVRTKTLSGAVRGMTKADYISAESLLNLAQTPCGLSCACGTVLDTEADFAGHFTISDPNFLNLGDCSR